MPLNKETKPNQYMCYNQTGDISTLDGTPLKLVDKFTYLGSSVASTEKDIDTRLTKAWTATNRLSIIWKSDLTDKMKRSFFQAAVTSILLYGCTTWTREAGRQLHKNAACNLEQVLAATPDKTPTARPPASYHENYSSYANQTCRTLLEKQGRTYKWCTLMDHHTWPTKSRTTSTNIHSATMWGYRMLSWRPGAMNDREKWRKRVRDIRATSTTW